MSALVLRIARRTLRAELPSCGWAAETEYETLDDMSAAIGQLVAEIPGAHRGRRVVILVETPLAQTRTLLDLPAVRTRDLRALVAQHAARFFRKNGHALITDAVWMKARRGERRTATAVAVEEALVRTALGAVGRAGLEVMKAGPAERGSGAKLSVLPADDRRARGRSVWKGLARLGTAVVLAWALVFALYGVKLSREQGRLDRELATLGSAVAALTRVRQEMRQADAVLGAIAAADRARGQALMAIARVAGTLPDSAYLTSLALTADSAGRLREEFTSRLRAGRP